MALMFMMAVCFLSACSDDEEGVDLGPGKLPTMKALGVSTVISDSGITRFRATTPEWLVYSQEDSSYWYFPQGLRLEQFDELMTVESNVYCDTAKYFVNLKLWKLDGHVKVMNRKGEKFETEQLFWSQNESRVYSDKPIKIQQKDCIIQGVGFESNETMTNYVIRHPTGIIPIND